MAYGFEPVQSQPWGGALAQMLATLAAQGNAARLSAMDSFGPSFNQGFGIGARQAEIGREREFRASEDQKQRDFAGRQARLGRQADWANEVARRRDAASARSEGRRQFDVSQRNVSESRLRDDLAALERVAQAYAESGQPVPPGLAAQLDAMRARVTGFGGPATSATSRTPGAMSESMAAGAASRLGGGWDFSRGPTGSMKPGATAPAPKTAPGSASRNFQSRQWAGFVASDPSVRAVVRGMGGIEPKRPEARFYAAVADALRKNRDAGFPLTLKEIKDEARKEFDKEGLPSFAGVRQEAYEPTPYVWGPSETVIDPRTKQTMDNRELMKQLGGELTTHPSASRNLLGGISATGPVFVRKTGKGVVKSHPAFSDEVMNAVIDQIASELGYGAE